MPHLAIKKIKRYNQLVPPKPVSKDPAQREELIAKYAPLVKTIAGRLAVRLPRHVSKDDLCGAGIIGLLDAIDKFDVDKGVDFKSYAEFRIRGAMLDELRSMDWVPRSVRKNARRLEEAFSKVEKEKRRPAEDEEVAGEMGLALDGYYRLLDEVRGISIISDDELCNITPGVELNNIWHTNYTKTENNPGESLDLREVKEVIARAVDRLPKNERTVVSLYYYEELTMKEIGGIMGYTESRVSQLHTKAAMRLRGSLRDYFDRSER